MEILLAYIPRGHSYFSYYWDPTYILVIIGAMICMAASANVKQTFARYSRLPNKRGITGAQVAKMILDNAGIVGIRVEHISGELTDNFSPRENTVHLSDSVYDSTSIAAIGVAAHECGHVIQHHKGYAPIKIRNAIIPVVNFGSMLAWPVMIIGLVVGAAQLFKIGILLFSFTLLFQVVTLPVEFNASRRALKILSQSNLLYDDEIGKARSVLTAAAMTYVAAAISTLLQLLRLILLFGNRRDD